MRPLDEHDYKAQELYDMVRDDADPDVVINAMSQALRDAERYGRAQAGKASRTRKASP